MSIDKNNILSIMNVPLLEREFLNVINLAGSNITDPTEIFCDICHERGESSKGGYVLHEKENKASSMFGQFTYACTKCYKDFTCQSEEERNKKDMNHYQKVAQKWSIGTDIDSYFEFNKEKSFRDNVITFKRDELSEKDRSWSVNISWKGKNERAKTKKELLGHEHFICNTCKEILPSNQLRKCSGCRMAYYCSLECQKKDWKDHRKDCINSKK